jgi:tRNA-specific 2-thiouridylase
LYVLGKNAGSNTLVVCEQSGLGTTETVAYEANWIAGEPPAETFRAEVKSRYTATAASADVQVLPGNRFQLHFLAPQRDLTPGQSAVLYQEDILLGGGILR